MKTEVRNLSQCRVRMTVTCEKEMVKKALTNAKTNTGEENFAQSVADALVKQSYAAAVKEYGLPVISTPYVKLDASAISEDQDFTYVCEVEIYPEIELGQYKGVAVTKQSATVSNEDVKAYVQSELNDHVGWEIADRALQEGDTAVFDFEGFVDGEPFEGGSALGYELVIGSNNFIDGFESGMIGMQKDENRDLVLRFPLDYAQDLAGKEAVFRVLLHEIKQPVLPVLNDDFVASLSIDGVKTIAQYLSYVQDLLTQEAQRRADDVFTNDILKAVCENATADLPVCFVDRAAQNHIKQAQDQASAYGISYEDMLSLMNLDKETFENQIKRQAQAEVLRDLVLGKIARVEQIAPSQEELEEGYRLLAANHEITVEEVKQTINEQQLTDQMTALLTIQFLKDNAVIKEA